MSRKPIRNHVLDALRGIAALLVLATHLQSSITGFYPGGWLASHPVAVATLEHSAIGVDVFFLISGFIVYLAARWVIHAGKGVRLFLLKRFLRIFMPYWPIALALAAAYMLLPGLSSAADPIQVNWIKSLTLIPGGGDYSLSVAWTLSFELFFYVLLVLSLAFRRPALRWGLILIPSVLALIWVSAMRRVEFGQANTPLTLLANPYQWEFLLGCGVAVLAGSHLPWTASLRRRGFLLVGLLLLAGLLLFWPFAVTFTYRLALLLVLSVLILLSTLIDVQFPGLSALAWVGGISYSLYLVHNPMQSLVIRLALPFGQQEAVAALLLVLVPLLVAVFYFRSFETWSLQLIERASARLQSA
jgi:exopolysaccharide production protein ExoZ